MDLARYKAERIDRPTPGEVAAMIRDGERLDDLADTFGCSAQTLRNDLLSAGYRATNGQPFYTDPEPVDPADRPRLKDADTGYATHVGGTDRPEFTRPVVCTYGEPRPRRSTVIDWDAGRRRNDAATATQPATVACHTCGARVEAVVDGKCDDCRDDALARFDAPPEAYDVDDLAEDDEPETDAVEPEPASDPVAKRQAPTSQTFPRLRPQQTPRFDHDDAVRRYEAGESTVALAKAYGVTPTAVGRVLKQRGVQLRPPGKAPCARPPATVAVVSRLPVPERDGQAPSGPSGAGSLPRDCLAWAQLLNDTRHATGLIAEARKAALVNLALLDLLAHPEPPRQPSRDRVTSPGAAAISQAAAAGPSRARNSREFPTDRPRKKTRRRTSHVDTADIVRRYQDGQTIPAIAKALHHNTMTVRRHLLDAGVQLRDDRHTHSGKHNHTKTYPAELVDQVRRLYLDEQMSQTEVAQRLGIGTHVVQRLMDRHHIPARPAANVCGPKGDRNSASKLTDTARDDICRRYLDDCEPAPRLAAEYGVTPASVYALLHKRGITRRTTSEDRALHPRPGVNRAEGLTEQIRSLGVTSLDIKLWAHEQGLVDRVKRGLPTADLVDAYVQAHPEQQGDTA